MTLLGVADVSSGSRPASRRRAVSSRAAMLVAVVLSFGMIGVRIAEAQVDPLAWVRIAIGVATMAFVLFSRRRSLLERAALAFCIEAIAAIAMFAFVDAPFVDDHAADIARLSSSTYARLTNRDLGRDVRATAFFSGRSPISH